MSNPVNLPEPLPDKSFEHLTGLTWDGKEVELYVEGEVNVAYVNIQTEHIGYLQFNFDCVDADLAKQFFIALCSVRDIIQEGK